MLFVMNDPGIDGDTEPIGAWSALRRGAAGPRHRPVWLYPVEKWADPLTALGPQHDDLRASITKYLSSL